jgi:hypothetical protein
MLLQRVCKAHYERTASSTLVLYYCLCIQEVLRAIFHTGTDGGSSNGSSSSSATTESTSMGDSDDELSFASNGNGSSCSSSGGGSAGGSSRSYANGANSSVADAMDLDE